MKDNYMDPYFFFFLLLKFSLQSYSSFSTKRPLFHRSVYPIIYGK